MLGAVSQIMSMDEMKNNVEALAKMQQNLESGRDELEGINKEEALLEWEQSQFPLLQHMFQIKEPYDKLWNTALSFSTKSEEWMNGEGWCGPTLGLVAGLEHQNMHKQFISTDNLDN